jgi:hypothetical protein
MSEVYDLLLVVHSFTRWCVLVSSAGTTGYALWALRAHPAARLDTSGARSARDHLVGRVFVICVDVQVLLGMSLYFGVSPLARAARSVWAERGLLALCQARELRFFGLIHPALALSAAWVAHVGWVAVRRAQTPEQRQRALALGAGLGLLLFLLAVPWPFLGHERPWFRF